MIEPRRFLEILSQKGIGLFTGVPDSLLSGFCAALPGPGPGHLVAANEGNAVGLAAGHFLATGRPALVYMQNSGLGNAVNPLASLADPEVYGLPMLLLIGWRGQPGVKDEPQHVKQGRITPALLEALEIPFAIIGPDSGPEAELDRLWKTMMDGRRPVALLARAGTFGSGKSAAGPRAADATAMSREEAIETVLELLQPDDLIVSTTGKASRELFELRKKRGEDPADFLTVGGMGHASSIALGAALARPDRRLVVFDGDGALLMHLGALALAGTLRPANLIHIVLNNYCHESVGGQPTCSAGLDLGLIAEGCGYPSRARAVDPGQLRAVWPALAGAPGPHFLELALRPGSRADLGRPKSSPADNRDRFMRRCQGR